MERVLFQTLKQNKLFNKVDTDSLIIDDIKGNFIAINQGEILFREGEIVSSLFLVMWGEINVIRKRESKTESLIFHENDFFGQEKFLNEDDSNTTVVALRNSYILELTKKDVEFLGKQNEQIYSNIYNSQLSLSADNSEELAEQPEISIRTEAAPKEEVETSSAAIDDTDKSEKLRNDQENLNSEGLNMRIEQLERINEAAHLVNSNINLDDLLQNITDVSVDLAGADRGTLYLFEKNKNQLWSKITVGNTPKEIRLKIGDGLAGWVAKYGETVNIEDAYSDERFDMSYDNLSGYQTKSVLCYPVKNKEGEVISVIQLLNNKNGAFSSFEVELLDLISTHVALALQNADLVEQLLKTERVSSLGKMANFLIEDIKKPILISKRYAEHLRSKEMDTDVSQIVNMLLDELNNITDLIQATSNYSAEPALVKSTYVNLNETLDDLSSRIDSYVRSMSCKIEKEYAKDVLVNLNLKDFYQSFKHIIKNACEAMPHGGVIQLKTKIDENNILIIFNDKGSGIPESLWDKIFEPFMSYGKKNGPGLGLTVTKKIIEEHGGTIKVNSYIGIGTSVIVTLPIIK
ncbi:MAG: GAF domain-containing protein [Chlorobi bacterium]|nr:GAF domain-containing protein [Chlorobiota bacterium]